MKQVETRQRETCQELGVEFLASPPDQKLGIARSVRSGGQPIHGLRHPPEAGTCGWFIWSGEWSDDPAFFVPLHVEHLATRCPEIVPLLGLPPGSRFLLAGDHRDVWHDDTLLRT